MYHYEFMCVPYINSLLKVYAIRIAQNRAQPLDLLVLVARARSYYSCSTMVRMAALDSLQANSNKVKPPKEAFSAAPRRGNTKTQRSPVPG